MDSVETQHLEAISETAEQKIDSKIFNNKKLQTKTAVEFLLEGKLRNQVCRYCLNVDSCLWELDRVMNIAIKGIAYAVPIRTMVASFHHIKVGDDPNFPNKICETCLEQILSCYIFSQQCERAERALRNCFDDITEKILKLDPLEPNAKKRGRQKLNPNYNTLYVSHANVIDYAEPIISLINTTSSVTDEVKIEINPNECTKCWQEFPNIVLLKNHEKIHPKTMWFHCRFCGKSFAKSNHLKKHINSAHKKTTVKPTEVENFKCKECGHASEQYSQHLQHIEKHKFKTFLNLFMENKLNKICAVCLDNITELTDMDKMICFHGGIPGLTGDINLKSIIKSTITNKNMNKYQELHVANQASVLKMTIKKRKETSTVSLPKLSKSIFAQPLIIEDNCEEYAKTSNVFLFSEPIKEIMPGTNATEMPQKKEDNDGSDLQKNVLCLEEMTVKKEHKTLALLKKNINSVPELITDSHKTVETPKTCKKCWIFGKTCNHNADIQQNETNQGKCNYCWIFKHTHKCFYCNKLSKIVTNVDDINVNPTVTKEVSKDIATEHKNKDNLNSNSKSLMLNVEESDQIVSKKAKLDHETTSWLCKVCLTKNTDNKQKCGCCDADKDLNDESKFNFAINTKVSDDTEEKLSISVNDKAADDFVNKHPDLGENNIKNVNLTTNDNDNTDNYEMDTEQPIQNAYEMNTLMEICDDDNPFLNTHDKSSISSIHRSEAMNFTASEVNQNPANFIFTIGSGSAKTKKRLYRKIGNSRN